MAELAEPKKGILCYFAFRISVANALIHSLLKKPSPTPSLAEDENDEPPPKQLAFHIKQLIPMKLGSCLKWWGIGIIEVGAGMRSDNCTMYRLLGFLCFTSTTESFKTFHDYKKNNVNVICS
ncbi:hypothetical protein TNCV_3245411 [Trichonephila clavipes]|nr:hypothetical protein TNCV_3245411 [Trichonephila clavipes]